MEEKRRSIFRAFTSRRARVGDLRRAIDIPRKHVMQSSGVSIQCSTIDVRRVKHLL